MAELDPGAGGWADFPVGDTRFGDISSFFEPGPVFPGIQVTPTHTGSYIPVGSEERLMGFGSVLAGISLPAVLPFPGRGTPDIVDAEVDGSDQVPAEAPPPYVIDPNERPEWVAWEYPRPGVGLPTPNVSTGAPGTMWEGLWDAVGSIGGIYAQNEWGPQPQAPMGFAAPAAAVAAAPTAESVFGDASVTTAAPRAAVAAVNGGNGGCCPPGAGGGPKYAKICLSTGQVTPFRRRRRRKLLTSSDLNQLAALKAIIGGGAGLNAAVVKAMR